ncbi:MAG TPA: hypothetical protein VIM99_15925 [Blastocatellia bacterium]
MFSSIQIAEAEIALLSVAETPWGHLGLDREWFDQTAELDDHLGSSVLTKVAQAALRSTLVVKL